MKDDEAEMLRELTSRLLAGEALLTLVNELDERGVRSVHGRPIKINSLQELVLRPINCGRITHTDSKTGTRTVLGHLPGEPIISEEDFDRLCALFASRRRGRPNSPKYLCSGLSVCGRTECGHALHGRPRRDMKPYPDGEVTRSYICNPGVGGCGKTEIDQRAVDEAAATLAIEILSDPRNTTAIESAARQIASETARLDLAIAEAEDVAEALADRLGRGEITLTRYDVAVKPLEARIAKLRAERDALPDPDTPGPVAQQPLKASREQWKRRWDAADHKERRDLLKMALRGKHLVVAPAERGRGSTDQAEIIRRIRIS